MFGVIGDGKNYFSSIHVDDAASAIVAALNAPAGTYNVDEDDPSTQADYAAGASPTRLGWANRATCRSGWAS